MNKIYMDESGYTGADLLDKNQPIQGASSIMIDEVTAEKLVEDLFPKRQSRELKHSKLARRKTYWKNLLELQKILLNEYMGFTYVCHKKFLLILMFLDACVEPSFYNTGFNFYEDGQNFSLASLILATAPQFWGNENLDELLYFFQRAVKTKTSLNIQVLIEKAKTLHGKKLSEILVPLITEEMDCIESIKNGKVNTDAAFVVLISLITQIEKHIKSKYKIIHDNSKNLLMYNNFLKQFIGIKDEKTFRATASTGIRFPIKLKAVEQIDSKLSFGVQLADLLIGGMVEHVLAHYGIKEKNDYNQSIIDAYGNENLLYLFPSVDFEKTKEFRANNDAIEFIDFLSNKIS